MGLPISDGDFAVDIRPKLNAAIVRTYRTRALAVADLTVLGSFPDGTLLDAGGESYVRLSTSTFIGDMPGWEPLTAGVSPEHFGGAPGQDIDSGQAINRAIAAAATTYDAALGNFTRFVDFKGRPYRSDISIDATMIRQPGFSIRNGTLYSRATNKIALDLSGSNTVTIADFNVWGDATYTPRVGILFSRCLIGSGYPAAAYNKVIGNSSAEGVFGWAAFINLASEVSSIEGTVQIVNRSRSLTAVAAAHVASMAAIANQFGADLESEYTTLPTTATGNMSNICHDVSQANFRRTAAFNLTVTGITNANPGVVTVTSGTLAGAGLANGDQIFISGGNIGMTDVAGRVYTVAGLNTANDTFQLSGKNTTSSGAYTSGASIQNRTGPAWLTQGARSVDMAGGYLLSYGSPNIVVDGNAGAPIRDWRVNFQSERDCPTAIEFRLDSGTLTCPEIHLSTPMHEQTAWDATVKLTGTSPGNVVFNGGSFVVSNMAAAPANGLFYPWANFVFRGNYRIAVPLQAALTGLPSTFDGTTYASDRAPKTIRHNFTGDTIEALTGIGYGSDGTGASKYAVTQLTSKTTGVTINAPCGFITMNNASLSAGATATFLVTNSFVDGSDVVKCSSRGATSDKYRITESVTSGGFYVSVTNLTGGSLAEAHGISFVVLKAVQA